MTAAQLAAAGLTSSFTQSGQSDTEPPVLQSLSLSPSAVNTGTGPQNITVTARVVDNLAGTGTNRRLFDVRFRSPSGNQFIDVGMFDTQRTPVTSSTAPTSR